MRELLLGAVFQAIEQKRYKYFKGLIA